MCVHLPPSVCVRPFATCQAASAPASALPTRLPLMPPQTQSEAPGMTLAPLFDLAQYHSLTFCSLTFFSSSLIIFFFYFIFFISSLVMCCNCHYEQVATIKVRTLFNLRNNNDICVCKMMYSFETIITPKIKRKILPYGKLLLIFLHKQQ